MLAGYLLSGDIATESLVKRHLTVSRLCCVQKCPDPSHLGSPTYVCDGKRFFQRIKCPASENVKELVGTTGGENRLAKELLDSRERSNESPVDRRLHNTPGAVFQFTAATRTSDPAMVEHLLSLLQSLMDALLDLSPFYLSFDEYLQKLWGG